MNLDADGSQDDSAFAGRAGAAAHNRGAARPMLIIMHGEASSPGRIGLALQRRGHTLDIRKPRFGCALPQTLQDHAGVVVFGGPMSCNDPDDFVKREIDFTGVALKECKPYLGICLGAQMLAKHLGAAVGKHTAGKVEIGYHPIAPTLAGQSLGPWPARVYQWHREGFEVPAGGTKLAEGAVFANQAFSYGPSALGLQFHPEITYALVNRWTVMAREWKDRDGAEDRAAQLGGHLLNSPAVAGWFERLLDVWSSARLEAA
jgi:GMP synthase (glutamine-hydrolysing)